jgi:hypothetical protein
MQIRGRLGRRRHHQAGRFNLTRQDNSSKQQVCTNMQEYDTIICNTIISDTIITQ